MTISGQSAPLTQRYASYDADGRAKRERFFPWPGDPCRRDAVLALRAERERRADRDLANRMCGEPVAADAVKLSDDDTVTIVIQALRGQRERWTPDAEQ